MFRTSCTDRYLCAALLFGALTTACGGSSGPTGPTPPPPITLTAPQPVAPADDELLTTLQPTLEITNASSNREGARRYEFQVSDSETFTPVLAPGLAAIVSTETVDEAPGGKTSWQVEEPLRSGVRLYWRARALQDTATGPWSTVAKLRTPAMPNVPPEIRGLAASSRRAEVDATIDLTASVTDRETPSDQLIYEWTAMAGTFSGTGPVVTWRAPTGVRTPVTYDLTLTVVEKYTETDYDGTQTQKEHRVTAMVRVDVNDSDQEITELALTFLKDFANSNVPPEVCVRNFSDNCRGKDLELADIQFNRATRIVQSATFSVELITYDAARVRADIVAPCRFVSTIKASGQSEIANGNCLLSAVYENKGWLLCESLFRGNVSSGLRFTF